jgi:hypothetical protein
MIEQTAETCVEFENGTESIRFQNSGQAILIIIIFYYVIIPVNGEFDPINARYDFNREPHEIHECSFRVFRVFSG